MGVFVYDIIEGVERGTLDKVSKKALVLKPKLLNTKTPILLDPTDPLSGVQREIDNIKDEEHSLRKGLNRSFKQSIDSMYGGIAPDLEKYDSSTKEVARLRARIDYLGALRRLAYSYLVKKKREVLLDSLEIYSE